jgi:N-acetylglutamate synthase
VRQVEERALNAWPAFQTVLCNGWALRFSDGYTKRANSANAVTPSGRFDHVRRVVEALYPRQGLPAVFRLSPLAGGDVDAELASVGYRHLDDTLVMTSAVKVRDGLDPEVVLSPVPDQEWLAGFAAANGVDGARRATHDRIVSSIPFPAAFACVWQRGTPAAYGVAVTERGMVGLFDIVTVPSARRQGLARRLVSSLLAWGRSEGAGAAYLQVVAANQAAVRLYEGFGFAEAYRYHYRVLPQIPAPAPAPSPLMPTVP